MENPIREMLAAHAAKGFTAIGVREKDLLAIYRASMDRIDARLAEYWRTSNPTLTGPRFRALLENIDDELLPELQRNYGDGVREALTWCAKMGAKRAAFDLGQSAASGFNGELFRNVLADDFSHVAGATRKMSEAIVGTLRRASSDVMAKASLTGMTRGEVTREIRAKMGDTFEFRDASGRKWDPDNYFKMLGRTMLHNNARTCYVGECASRGCDIVTISISGNPCDACAQYEDRLLSISGKTRGLPTLDEARRAGLFHPNCTHRMIAVPEEIAAAYFDKSGKAKEVYTSDSTELKNMQFMSDRSAKIPPQSEKANYGTSSKKDRENAEIYAKKMIADEVVTPPDYDASLLITASNLIHKNMKEFKLNKFKKLSYIEHETSFSSNYIMGVSQDQKDLLIDFHEWRIAVKEPEKMINKSVKNPLKKRGIRSFALEKKEKSVAEYIANHESGHMIYNKLAAGSKEWEKRLDNLFDRFKKSGEAGKISNDALSSKNGFCAEIFAVYKTYGTTGLEKLGLSDTLYAETKNFLDFFVEAAKVLK